MSPDQFIRKICHDLRAPIRGLADIPSWVEEDLIANQVPIPASVRELLELQKTQAQRLNLIVIGLSEHAKLKRDESQPSTPITALEPSSGWPENLQRNVDIDHLPMEEDHAMRAIEHLISNAYKHGDADEHGARLSIGATQDSIRIAVTDFGTGVEPEFVEKIYEPLYTLKPRDVCEGSGMGLAIVARIAELYGGSRSIRENEDGPGMVSELVVPTL